LIERNFGATDPLTLGVEEELMLVDAATLGQVPAVKDLLADAGAVELAGTLKTELFASVVELNTPVCASIGDVEATLGALRRGAGDLAARRGLRLMAAGTHPLDVPEQQAIVDEPRYEEMVATVGATARRQGVQGLHVHVALPTAESCLHVLEEILPWLPLLLALSANSPYLGGNETGLASNRAEVLAQLPRSGAPPAFASFAEWEQLVERFRRLGVAAEYTAIWWDVRPHPRFGTIEVRMVDQPTAVEVTLAFVALLQAMCATALESEPRPVPPWSRSLYQQNRWAASLHGPRAELAHPDGDRVASVPALLSELLERVSPAAARLGAERHLRALDAAACEGDRQLEVGRSDGLPAACADLVERSVASP